MESPVRNTDSSELQHIVDDLRKSIAWMDLVLANLSESICVVDKTGSILFANDAFADLVSKVRIVMLGEKIWSVLNLSTTDGQGSSLLTPQTLGSAWSSDRSSVLNGNYMLGEKTIELTVQYIPKLEQMVFMIRDITKEKAADKMKTEFISLASHQLRTPLSAINWFSEMLVKNEAGELNNEQREFMQNIFDSSHRMTRIVNDLLNVSRIESGKVVIEPQSTDLNTLIKGVLADLDTKIKEKKHSLNLKIAPNLPEISLDPNLISQVYTTLINNAIRYTKESGDISLEVMVEEGELVSKVTDNGMGVPESQQSKIFQKFFRADNVVKVETDGTGLGLYLTKKIIETSGGQIGFESQEGVGSTFWFKLPLSGMRAKPGDVRLRGIT